MATLQPTFSLTIGSLNSTTENPVGGPTAILVERDLETPVDGLRLQLSDRSGIELGNEVSLDLGHDGSNETVFVGKIVRVQPTLTGTTAIALGKLQALLDLRTAATYENQTVGQIANDLISQAGLSAGTVSSGPTLPLYSLDRRLNGWMHLKALADRLGYELYGDRQGNVMFQGLGEAANLDAGSLGGLASAAIALAGTGEGYGFGQHLLQAAATRQAPIWGEVTVGGESPMSRQGDTKAHWLTTQDNDHQGVAGEASPALLLLDPVARTKDLADRFAAGQLARAARQVHTVQFRILGRPQIELGDTLSTSDVPDGLLNGSGYVRSIRHRFSPTIGFVSDLTIALGGTP